MNMSTSGDVAPTTEHLFTDKELRQVLWLVHGSLLSVDFNDPRVAACLKSVDDDFTETVEHTAAAIKKGLEAATVTQTSESPEDVNGNKQSTRGAQTSENINEKSQTHMRKVPEHLSKTDEPQVPGLNARLLAQWWAEYQNAVEKHKSESKISRETLVTVERCQEMAKLFLNVIGEKGQQNFKECLWARRHCDDFVSQISGVLEGSGSMEDCRRAWRHLLEVCPLYSATDDIQERLAAPASNEPCKKAFQTICKSQMVQAEGYRRECLATMWFAEQWDGYSETLKNDSSERESLKQYSEAKGRYLGQGVGYQSFVVDRLVDNSDTNSASFPPEMREKQKRKMRNARTDGRWFSKVNGQFGRGIFCYIRVATKTALKSLKGRQLMEVFVAFLEATATVFPNLKEIFDYSIDATTGSASEAFLLTTPFRKLLSNMNQNPDHTFELIKGADVLNTEFDYQSSISHRHDNTGSVDGADAVARQLGDTEFMNDD